MSRRGPNHLWGACWLAFAAALPGTARCQDHVALTIESPQEYQVLQRDECNQVVVPVRVRAPGWADHSMRWDFLVWRSGEFVPTVAEQSSPAVAPDLLQTELRVPAGGWYQLVVRGTSADSSVVIEAKREHFGVGEVFVVAGQSNAANSGAVRQQTETEQVSSFDGHTWRLAHDPQLGASGDGGSFMPAMGDTLARRLGVPIGIVPIAQGATSVREWLPQGTPVDRLTTTGAGLVPAASGGWESDGRLFGRLTERLAALGSHGFRTIVWHQGESDAGQARSGYPVERQISGDDYVRYMQFLIESTTRAAGWNVPWITAVTTYHSEDDSADDEFRTAQQSLWQKQLSFQGPDTDLLRGPLRDGVHFNAQGLQRHGGLWADKITNWLEQKKHTDTKHPTPFICNGRLDEPFWQQAELIRDFSFPWSDKTPPATEFRAAVVEDWLAVAFVVEDHDVIAVPAWTTESTLDGEDRVEIFFACDADLKRYYCLEIDPLGRVHDYAASYYRRFDSHWNLAGLQTSARRTSDGYIVEFAVPLNELSRLLGQSVRDGSVLRIGLFRAQFTEGSRGESVDDWLSHVRPDTTSPDFHVPSAFWNWTAEK